MQIDGREITPEDLQLTQLDDGSVRIENAPLPEYIAVTPNLWEEFPEWTPETEWPPTDPAPWAWREVIGHADPDRDNDGYMLHLDATNVSAAYRLLGDSDGNRVLRLERWSEH